MSQQNEIVAWFRSIPPVTRALFSGTLAVSLLGNLRVVPFSALMLAWGPLRRLELWRLVTAYLAAPFGFPFLMQLFFVYTYGKALELGHFKGRPGDFVFCLVFTTVLADALVLVLFGGGVLSSVLEAIVVYLWSQLNRDSIVSFMFGLRFQARYFPLVLIAYSLLLGQMPVLMILGFLVAHVYYFLTIIYPSLPSSNGRHILQTPAILYLTSISHYFIHGCSHRVFPPTEQNFADMSGSASGNKPGAGQQKFSWGKGQKLGTK